MRVISWNVQVLGGSEFMRYRGQLRQELQKCVVGGRVDVLMLQEHHLSESRLRRYGSLMSGQWDTFWSASFGPMGGQGGVCMAIAEPWRQAIVDRGIVVPDRAQYVTF